MRLLIVVALPVFAFASVAWPEPVSGGATRTTPARGGKVTPAPSTAPSSVLPQVLSPDLVIKQVVITREGGLFGAFSKWRYHLTVANVGNRAARPTITALVTLSVSVEQPESPVTMKVKCEIETPALAPGTQAVVTWDEPHHVRPEGSCLLAMADFPTLTFPAGAVREVKEGNNILVVPLARLQEVNTSRYVFQ